MSTDVTAALTRAADLLSICSWRFRHGTDNAGIAEELAAVRETCAALAALDPASPAGVSLAICRSTEAAYSLRHCCDANEFTFGEHGYDGPLLDGAGEEDDDGLSARATARAVHTARAAAAADPSDPLAVVQLAEALTWAGDEEGATAAYREALRRDPGDDVAAERLVELGASVTTPPRGTGRPYGFVLLLHEARSGNSEWWDTGFVYGSVHAARARADAVLTAIGGGDIRRAEIGEHHRLRLEIHDPGAGTGGDAHGIVAYDVVALVPDEPGAGPFRADWSALPQAASGWSALGPGRILRFGGLEWFGTSPGPEAAASAG